MGETVFKLPSVFLIMKNLAEFKWCSKGEVGRRTSPPGPRLREPIASELCSSRYAPAHHGAQQGKAATGSGNLQPQHLPWRWYRNIDLQKTAGLTLQQYFPVPKGTYHQLTRAGSLLPPDLRSSVGQRERKGTPGFHFAPNGSPCTANTWV
ncbi:hypothetical protein AVEN_168019-1 [Araneus ventricosus]|uniref:Uncharacterized protein n=1 Tax=Araneus ventricosus TaxID=182803 RepID=A0A4Y2QRQ1_ARAVE|nr:hypothetical protein AVEN_168019-1 [Araneus ventricosus]